MESGPSQRRVLVSGGGTGIGHAIARRFLEDDDAVTIVGRRTEVLEAAVAELDRAGGAIDHRTADLSDPDDVTALIDRLTEQDGTIDVIVNAAGGLSTTRGSSLPDVARAWRDDLAGNLLTAVLLTEAARPHLSENARIVSIGSIAGSTGAGSYGAAKAALIAWNCTIAAQVAGIQATANVIAPGYVTDTEFFGDAMTPERHERLVGRTLVGRPGTPDDVAASVAFLASDEAAWITGQVLHVNGGALLAR